MNSLFTKSILIETTKLNTVIPNYGTLGVRSDLLYRRTDPSFKLLRR